MIELGFEFDAMACGCEVRLVGADEVALRAAAAAAIGEVRRIEHKYSRYRGDSLLARWHEGAGSGRQEPVDGETAGLLDFAAALFDLSGGRFDVTAGVLRRAWDFRGGRPPTPEHLQSLLPLVGWPQLRWTGADLGLPRPGMEIDFGGFGKEYAADRAAAELLRFGVSGGYVELGGDIRVIGPGPDGRPWRFGIAHPRRPGALLACVDMASGGLATSGDYERWFEHEGRRYCHLLDARTGLSMTDWQSVSVIAPTCAAAGAVATIAALFGAAAPDFLAEQAVDYLAVDHAGHPWHVGNWRLEPRSEAG